MKVARACLETIVGKLRLHVFSSLPRRLVNLTSVEFLHFKRSNVNMQLVDLAGNLFLDDGDTLRMGFLRRAHYLHSNRTALTW